MEKLFILLISISLLSLSGFARTTAKLHKKEEIQPQQNYERIALKDNSNIKLSLTLSVFNKPEMNAVDHEFPGINQNQMESLRTDFLNDHTQ